MQGINVYAIGETLQGCLHIESCVFSRSIRAEVHLQ